MLSSALHSQEWVDLMQDPESNVHDATQAFEEYWENHEIEKGKGYKQFKRWEYFMTPRVYPSGERFAPDATAKELDRELMDISTGSRSVSGAWTYVGNESVPSSGGGAGRVNSVRMDPNNPNRVFACAPAGGLWKSSNSGSSWSTITDQLEHIGTSDVLIDPNNSQVIYLGTGDGDGGDTYSLGVLKSTNGGVTWSPTGLSWSYQHARRIFRLVMHPTNSNILFAATSTGVFRTTDAGTTWSNVKFGTFKDVKIHPTNPSIVYACGGTFFRSTDGGQTFDEVSNGLPTSGVNRMAIAVSEDAPSYVYVLCGNSSNSGFHGLYRSTNSGASFSVRSTSPNLLGWNVNGSDSGGQSWYDLAIAVDPDDADDVFVGGVNIWRSTNGGQSWSISAHWYGSGGNPYVHSDIHSLEFLNGQLYVGSDGGVFRKATSFDSYEDMSDGLDIAQIYCLGTSKTQPNTIITGWQDNGTNLRSGSGWDRVIGGDGMECLIDHTNASVMYGSLYNGSIYKSTNGGLSFNPFLNSGGSGVDINGSWVTPFVMDPNNHNILYIGKDNLYRTTNGGNSWTTISTPSSSRLDEVAIAPSDPNRVYCSEGSSVYRWDGGSSVVEITSNLPNKYIRYIAVSDTDEDHVWVCLSGFSSGKKVYESVNGGNSWTNISQGLPNIPTNAIVYQNGSNDGLYLGTDIGVYYRNASHSEWQPFFTGMPNAVVSELEINYTDNSLYAATYGRGVWKSDLFNSSPSNTTIDAGIAEILSPSGDVCNDEISPTVRLQNFGQQVLTSSVITYGLNGSSLLTYNWAGALGPGQSTIIGLPTMSVDDGDNTFTATSSSPNGSSDLIGSNDQVASSFSVATTESIVRITTDRYGSHTRWVIRDDTNVEVASGGPYSDLSFNGSFQQPDESLCLPTGCYEFTILDTYGDGICCTYGTGGYEILESDGSVAVSGGPGWTQTETVNFCINTSEYCEGDIDDDGLIGIDDFVLFNSVFGELCANCPQDLDGDGFVGSNDFIMFNTIYGTPCAASLFGQTAPMPLDESTATTVLAERAMTIHPDLLEAMKSMDAGNLMSVYPNPLRGRALRLNLSEGISEGKARMAILDLRGKKVIDRSISVQAGQTSFLIDLGTDLPQGAYIVTLRTDEQMFEQKLIKE